MLLWVIRALYLLILAGTAAQIASNYAGALNFGAVGWATWTLFVGIMGVGCLAVGLDLLYRQKRIREISAIYFGLLIGLLLGHLAGLALGPSLRMWSGENLVPPFTMLASLILCYVCVSFLLQTRDDFRFIIPYVEFSRQVRGGRPLILDTNVIIDGRIADIVDTGLVDQTLVVPRFVIREIQGIAESSDKSRRMRGRRGLDILNRIQACKKVEVVLHEDETGLGVARDVDSKLVQLAKRLNGRLATNDTPLAKSAKIQGVEAVNLHEVSNAARPPVMHGDQLVVRLVKEGEEPGQGIGYLDDGTMVVAEMGRNFVGNEINLIVTSVLQTNNGRMVFGRIDSKNPEPAKFSGQRH